jgi:hypothetical protein
MNPMRTPTPCLFKTYFNISGHRNPFVRGVHFYIPVPLIDMCIHIYIYMLLISVYTVHCRQRSLAEPIFRLNRSTSG